MTRTSQDDDRSEVSKAILKALPSGFVEEAERMDAKALRATIITAETSIREVEQEKAADEKLTGAKEIAKELSAPYRDAVKSQRAKIAYALHLLDGRGEL